MFNPNSPTAEDRSMLIKTVIGIGDSISQPSKEMAKITLFLYKK
jgi:hypothetical protein